MKQLYGKQQSYALLIAGILIGFINGFLGGGGGTLLVVVLLAVLNLHQKEAHATAMLVILPISLLSALIYYLNGNVEWQPTLFVTLGVVAGGITGALLLNKLKGSAVKLIFAIIMLIAGARMFF